MILMDIKTIRTFLNKLINILFPRKYEVKKVDTLISAGLVDAQENSVRFNSFSGRNSLDVIQVILEYFYGVFSIVVVPRDVVII